MLICLSRYPQSDDSELFFTFFRAYHRQLALYFPTLADPGSVDILKPSLLLAVPGYARSSYYLPIAQHRSPCSSTGSLSDLATIFSTKCLGYIQDKVVSVTTSSSSSTFNSDETAFTGSAGKPLVLQSANRKLSDTINALIGTPFLVDRELGEEVDGAKVWSGMSDVWVRLLVKKTNLYEPKGVT
jgi:hypothetical protein